MEPSSSPKPTSSPWPTSSADLTASGTPPPTTSPSSLVDIIMDRYINGDEDSSETGGRDGDATSRPSSILDVMMDQYIEDGLDNRPASPTPTSSSWPTSTPSSSESTETGGRDGDATSRPSSTILDVMVDQYIEDGLDNRPASPTPTSSPWPASTPSSSESTGIVSRDGDVTSKPSSILDVMVDQYIEDGLENRPAPTASPAPSVTMFPTSTPYPTASGTPTTSPFPTQSLLPTSSPWPTYIVEGYPTASPTPTISPFPTSSPWPTYIVVGYPTASPTPTISPFPTSSPWPTYIVEGYPTASPTPTISPFPTQSLLPTSSPWPTYLVAGYPTASPTPTVSPFPTQSLLPTSSPWPTYLVAGYPTASPTPTVSPFPTEDDNDTDVQDAAIADSVGYGHSCNDFEKGPQQIEEDLIFTYVAESRTTSTDFLNELEVHLLDDAASEALECATDSALHIYEIRYPDNQAASIATTCEPTLSSSKTCWILQTKMVITTDPASKTMAKYTVLADIQAQLNDGNLLTNSFQDLSYTKYLGPDPTETSFSRTPEPEGSNASEGDNNSVLYFALGAVGLAVASVFFFVGLLLYTRRRRSRNSIHLEEQSEDGSIEITELLSKSRERLKEHPDHFTQRGYTETDVEDRLSIVEGQEREEQAESDAIYATKDTTKSSASSSTRTASAAQRYYQKSRRSMTSESSLTAGSNSSQRKQEAVDSEMVQMLSSSGQSESLASSKQRSSQSSHEMRSPKRASLFEDPVASPVEHAEERRAFKGNRGKKSSGSPRHVDKLGDATFI